MFLKLIIFTIYLQILIFLQCNQLNGEVILDQFNVNYVNPDKAKDAIGRITKFNRTTYVMNYNFTLIAPIDNTVVAQAYLFALQGNEFRNIVTFTKTDICQYLNDDAIFYEGLLKSSNLPPKGECPILPGSYYIKNYPSEITAPAILLLHELWRVDIVLECDDQAVFSNISIIFKVVKNKFW